MPNQLCVVETGADGFGPLTLMRAVFDLRCGIMTLREKVEAFYRQPSLWLLCRHDIGALTAKRAPAHRVNEWPRGLALLLDARVIVDRDTLESIPLEGPIDVAYTCHGMPVAARVGEATLARLAGIPAQYAMEEAAAILVQEEVEVHVARYPWELVRHNARAIGHDFWELVSREPGDFHHGIEDEGSRMIEREWVRTGPGSHIKPDVVLDAEGGPIFIGRDVTILPGAVIEGPACIGDGSVVKIHGRIYPGTTIGPVCKVGGEIGDTIVHGYSNKQHDGFLGHAYIGEWVNLGAGTNNSDLKNNYGSVRVYLGGKQVDTGEMFVGLTMGDHSKTSIGTNFNTGTVVGCCCNIFGEGFPPKWIPSFTWGGSHGLVTYDLERCIELGRIVMARRDCEFGDAEAEAMRGAFERTREERQRAGIGIATAHSGVSWIHPAGVEL